MASHLQTISVTSRHAEFLSNGRYSVMVTPFGFGFSRCGQLAVTRWREDPTADSWGSFVLASVRSYAPRTPRLGMVKWPEPIDHRCDP